MVRQTTSVSSETSGWMECRYHARLAAQPCCCALHLVHHHADTFERSSTHHRAACMSAFTSCAPSHRLACRAALQAPHLRSCAPAPRGRWPSTSPTATTCARRSRPSVTSSAASWRRKTRTRRRWRPTSRARCAHRTPFLQHLSHPCRCMPLRTFIRRNVPGACQGDVHLCWSGLCARPFCCVLCSCRSTISASRKRVTSCRTKKRCRSPRCRPARGVWQASACSTKRRTRRAMWRARRSAPLHTTARTPRAAAARARACAPCTPTATATSARTRTTRATARASTSLRTRAHTLVRAWSCSCSTACCRALRRSSFRTATLTCNVSARLVYVAIVHSPTRMTRRRLRGREAQRPRHAAATGRGLLHRALRGRRV